MDAWKNLLDIVVMNFGGLPLIITLLLGAIVLSFSLCCCSALKCNLRHRCCCSFLYRPYYYPMRNKCCKLFRNRCCFCLNLSLLEIAGLFLVVLLHLVWGGFRFDGVQVMELSARGVNLCFGRLAVLNLILTIFTSHRLSLVRFFFDLGYEDSLAYHKKFGFLMFFWTFLHFLLVLISSIRFSSLGLIFGSQNETSHWPIYSNTGGTIGFICLTILIITSLSSYLRKKKYFVFYVTHISMTVLFFITVFVHRNEILMLILLVLAFFTILDFSYRWMYFLCFPSKVTKVEFYKPLKMVKLHLKLPLFFPKYWTGQVVDLYFPKFNPLLSHPYSICSVNGDLEEEVDEESTKKKKNELIIYIKKRGRFSNNIYKCSKNNTLKKKWVRVCGPFGTPFYSTTKLYKDIVLIGDGVCASGIIFSHLKNLLVFNQRQKQEKKKKRVSCFWMIRRLEFLEGFRDELEELYSSGMLKIYFVGDREIIEDKVLSSDEKEEEKMKNKKNKKRRRRRIRYKYSKKNGSVEECKYICDLSTFEMKKVEVDAVELGEEEEKGEELLVQEKSVVDLKEEEIDQKCDDDDDDEKEEMDQKSDDDDDVVVVVDEKEENDQKNDDDGQVSSEKEGVDEQEQNKEEEQEECLEEGGEEFETVDLDDEEEECLENMSPIDYNSDSFRSSSLYVKEEEEEESEKAEEKDQKEDKESGDEETEVEKDEQKKYKLETVEIFLGLPNWKKEFKGLKSRRIGMCVYGSKELVKEVKRNTFTTLGKTFHCYIPLYQM